MNLVHGFLHPYGADPVGVRTPTQIWLWGLLWLEPLENFIEINLLSAKSTPQEWLCKHINVLSRQFAGASLGTRTPQGSLQCCPISPSWWGGEHPLSKKPTARGPPSFAVRSFSPQASAVLTSPFPPQCCRQIGGYVCIHSSIKLQRLMME